jgi:hypothetical protein
VARVTAARVDASQTRAANHWLRGKQSDYDALFAEYERSSLPNQTPALEKIRDWVAGGECVALTCFDWLPQQCHRHCGAEALEERVGDGFGVTNL